MSYGPISISRTVVKPSIIIDFLKKEGKEHLASIYEDIKCLPEDREIIDECFDCLDSWKDVIFNLKSLDLFENFIREINDIRQVQKTFIKWIEFKRFMNEATGLYFYLDCAQPEGCYDSAEGVFIGVSGVYVLSPEAEKAQKELGFVFSEETWTEFG